MNKSNHELAPIKLLICLFLLCPFSMLAGLSPSSGTDAKLEEIPSAFWPPTIKTISEIQLSNGNIPKNYRGALMRIEEDSLIVDFGRHGVQMISPEGTDFYDRLTDYITGAEEKEFTNLALQVGNKLMDFGRGEESGAIRFEEIKDTEVYVFIYLDSYTPDMAEPLVELENHYQRIKAQYPHIEFVVMPKDREFYNFGFTVEYSIPFIATHMRIGYIKSLAHDPTEFPTIVITDSNGRLLTKLEANLEELGNVIETELTSIGIAAEKPTS